MTDENIEQECPECGALCLFDDGNYVAIESIPVARPSTSNTTPSTQAVGEPDTVMHNGKDIVQIWFESNRDIFTFYDRITAPTTGSEPWQVGDDTSSVQISGDGSTHKWGCKCEGCAPTTGSAPIDSAKVEDTGEPVTDDTFIRGYEVGEKVYTTVSEAKKAIRRGEGDRWFPLYRENHAAPRLPNTTPSTQAVGEPWKVGDDTSSVQISRDGSTHKWGCKCDGCVPTTGSAPEHPFALIRDRNYDGEGLSLWVWNGENYNGTDGDCLSPDPDGSLDGFTVEWLTDYALECRLNAASASPAASGGKDE